jgi:hypothetical protein
VTTRAAHGEVDVFGRRDLKSHVAADEFEAVVGADGPALQVRSEGGSAGRAYLRRVLDFSAHHDWLATPAPFRAGLFAGRLGALLLVRLVLIRLAGALRRGGGSLGVVARASRGRFASRITPIGVVARRRTRTGRRILARAVGQRPRQLMPPPRQVLKLLPRNDREVGPLYIVQVGDESARHARRRILFAPTCKAADRLSGGDPLCVT